MSLPAAFPPALEAEARKSVDCLLTHIRKADGYGYDPYDSRVGRLYRYMLYGMEFFAPVTFRKLRGIKKTWDPMGNSYFAGTLMTLYYLDKDPAKLTEARGWFDRIITKAVGTPGKRGFALGFICVTGSNKLWSTDVPVAHYTLRTARHLMIYEKMIGDGRYNDILEENMKFFTEVLPWVEVDGMVGVGYTPADPMQVINIWMDVASTLASYGALKGDHRFKDKAIALTESVLKHFLDDDTWPYHASWAKKPYSVDNSHTGMVIGAFADIAICYPEMRDKIVAVLEKATPKWIDLFFDESTGRHWNVKSSNHAAATAWTDALLAIHRLLRPELGISPKLADRLRILRTKMSQWSMDNMRCFDGRYAVFKYRYKKYSVGGVRSFDGMIADCLALTLAESKVPETELGKLWTI